MRDSRCTRLEVNEIRTFVGAKLENHMRAVSFYFMVYNCCKIHSSINTTPAMQAGVTTYLWTIEDIVMMSKTVHS